MLSDQHRMLKDMATQDAVFSKAAQVTAAEANTTDAVVPTRPPHNRVCPWRTADFTLGEDAAPLSPTHRAALAVLRKDGWAE